MLWDLYCRVVDNYGDIGVCWRLARDLASRGPAVRLATDDASALAWMAPTGAQGVDVIAWDDASRLDPGEVVIEAFGCNPPDAFVERMRRAQPPVWINLEYLSAEDHAQLNHGLRSPQLAGAGTGLTKWFYYPGFSAGTGGLLRERDLADRQAGFDREQWLRSHRIAVQPGERVVSLFCYDNPMWPRLLQALATQPTLLLATADRAEGLVRTTCGDSMRCGLLRAQALPYLPQEDFDHLLWACDFNFVRGEDSFVRAQWAGRPFVWHIYPQDGGVHAAKLNAFLSLYLNDAAPDLAAAVHALHAAWNGLGPWPQRLPDDEAWKTHAAQWRSRLWTQPDLVTRLLGFVGEKR
jgi:uncharacterized repeat protein (TIGR03837 family)